MSYVLTAIISMIIGSALGILMISIVSVTRRAEQENSIYREGFAEGHRIGLRKGKVLKIDTALYEELKSRATERVDVAPGPDSIRPDAKTTCPVVTSYNISNAQIRNIFDAEPAQEVPHD